MAGKINTSSKRGKAIKSTAMVLGKTTSANKSTTISEGKKTVKRSPKKIESDSVLQKDMFTQEEKDAYADKKFGKGNWVKMTRTEFKERMAIYEALKDFNI